MRGRSGGPQTAEGPPPKLRSAWGPTLRKKAGAYARADGGPRPPEGRRSEGRPQLRKDSSARSDRRQHAPAPPVIESAKDSGSNVYAMRNFARRARNVADGERGGDRARGNKEGRRLRECAASCSTSAP